MSKMKKNDHDNSGVAVVLDHYSPFLFILRCRLQMNKLSTGPGFLAGLVPLTRSARPLSKMEQSLWIQTVL